MSTMLRLLDRFFEKNPILVAAFVGVHPRALEEQATTDSATTGEDVRS